MSNLSKIKKTNLVCLTGTMGSGKTEMVNYLKDKGYEILVMDDYIKKIYKKNNIGYKRILKVFGSNFINEHEVNRAELLKFILLSSENKNMLDNTIIPLIEKKIKSLPTDRLIFIELGIYIYFPFIFESYFNKIVLIDRKNNLKSNDNFLSLNKTIKFSTKHVDKSNKALFSSTVSVDFIVENNGDLSSFYQKIENILPNLTL